MFRTIYFFIWLFFFFISVEPKYWKIRRLEKEGKIEEKDRILLEVIKRLTSGILRINKIKVEVEGKENIPPEGSSFLIVANHASFLDIPIVFFVFDRVLGFVSKKENGRVPFIGRWIRVLYSVFIDRSSAREGVKSLIRGAEIIKAGHPQAIFPDGTRSLDGKVHDFKAGSYKLAQKAKVPVVPMAIAGSYQAMPKGRFKIKSVTIKVKVFESRDSSELSTIEMAEKTQAMISEYVDDYNKNFGE